VICLHTGASGFVVEGSPNAPVSVTSCLLPVSAYVATIDWLWSGVPVRFDRLDHVMSHSARSGSAEPWEGDLTPSETVLRNFWFCMIDDPSSCPCGIGSASTTLWSKWTTRTRTRSGPIRRN
jgi:hypothetical protein